MVLPSAGVLLQTSVNGIAVQIDLPGVSEAAYKATEALLDTQLGNAKIKNREAISQHDGALFYVSARPSEVPGSLSHRGHSRRS